MCDQKCEKAQALGAAWRAAMVGTSPVERGRAKDRAALEWLWRWGWSTATTTDLAVSKRRGVAKRLADRRLTNSHESPGAAFKYYPRHCIVLSKAGYDLVSEWRDTAGMKHCTGEHIAWHQLRHDHIVQVWTAQQLARGAVVDYVTPREMFVQSAIGVKQPDALWVLEDGSKTAVELELTPKKPREQHAMVSRLTAKLGKGAFNHVLLLTRSAATARAFARLIAPGARRPQWLRLPDRHYIPTATDDVAPDWLESRISIEVLP